MQRHRLLFRIHAVRPLILLSHHRTGSTAIRDAIATRFCAFPGEPLLPFLDHGPAFDWAQFFTDHRAWQILHLHRHHVDILNGWQAIADQAAAIVHLTRQNRLHQALSLRRAIAENEWHEHPRGHSHGDAIELAELTANMTEWATFEAKAEFYFRELPGLRITYEEFQREPSETIDRVLSFLKVATA